MIHFQKLRTSFISIIKFKPIRRSWVRDGIYFGLQRETQKSRNLGNRDRDMKTMKKIWKIPRAKYRKSHNPGTRDLDLNIPKNPEKFLRFSHDRDLAGFFFLSLGILICFVLGFLAPG